MSALPTLSPRQREILTLVAKGQTSEQIGQALGISPSTVKNHLSVVYARLDVRSRTQAVMLAVQRGLIALIVLLLWLAAGPVAAQDPEPVEWHRGRVTNDVTASWWYAELADGIAPEVTSDYGEPGVHYWSYCPAPAYEPQTCIVQATGPWTKVTVNGVTLWERGRVHLPAVTR